LKDENIEARRVKQVAQTPKTRKGELGLKHREQGSVVYVFMGVIITGTIW
jgi:hypothetical protein